VTKHKDHKEVEDRRTKKGRRGGQTEGKGEAQILKKEKWMVRKIFRGKGKSGDV